MKKWNFQKVLAKFGIERVDDNDPLMVGDLPESFDDSFSDLELGEDASYAHTPFMRDTHSAVLEMRPVRREDMIRQQAADMEEEIAQVPVHTDDVDDLMDDLMGQPVRVVKREMEYREFEGDDSVLDDLLAEEKIVFTEDQQGAMDMALEAAAQAVMQGVTDLQPAEQIPEEDLQDTLAYTQAVDEEFEEEFEEVFAENAQETFEETFEDDFAEPVDETTEESYDAAYVQETADDLFEELSEETYEEPYEETYEESYAEDTYEEVYEQQAAYEMPSEHVHEAFVRPRNHGVVVALGMFDGVHAGHQHMLSLARRDADQLGLPLHVVTFYEHPAAVLTGTPVPYLSTFEDRMGLLTRYGMDCLNIYHFTPQFASMSYRDFINMMIRDLDMTHLVIGQDACFGRGGQGNAQTVMRDANELGISVHIVPAVMANGMKISSTTIRMAAANGDIAFANACLTRPYSLSGKVVHGAHRGTLLGFPTANLRPTPGMLVPANGVYVSTITLDNGKAMPAVTNIGTH
ncbi:MAG: hypothetical protein J6L88_04760, partial [Clostridia bacterium]|nr:hypothetical protein [Clostridia bacterium]